MKLAKFRENKTLAKWQNHCRFEFIDIGKSCLNREFCHITNVSFNAIRENKILAKIS